MQKVSTGNHSVGVTSRYASGLQMANRAIDQAIIQAPPQAEIVVDFPHRDGGASLFEPTRRGTLIEALRTLEQIGTITIREHTQDFARIQKLTPHLHPGSLGTEGDLVWHLNRLIALDQEVTSIQEITRLNFLISALRPPAALGSHSFVPDPRNASILISIDGIPYRRSEACVSALDRGVLLGDGIWESFRIENRHILYFDRHMDRFEANVCQLNFPELPREHYRAQLIEALQANRMESGVHVRMVVTRGDSITPFQSPKVAFAGPRVIIIPEYKKSHERTRGLHLILSPYRRSRSDMFSPELHVTSKVPDIINMIHAEQYGADEPLLLDESGNVKAGSSTCFFLVKDKTVYAPTDENLLQGVTRQVLIELMAEHPWIKFEKRIISTHDLYKGTEAFVTGTAGGVAYVSQVGNMIFNQGNKGAVVTELESLYRDTVAREVQTADYALG